MPRQSSRTCVDCGVAISPVATRCGSCARKAEHAGRRQDMTPPNPSGLCMCGCGRPAPVATSSSRKFGWVIGHPKQFVFGHGNHTRHRIDRSGPPVEGSDYRIEDRGYETPCWIWLRGIHHKGYGLVCINGRQQLAHRFAYEQLRGPIPDGLEPDHLCRQHDCINPAHLEAVTHTVNMRRASNTRLTMSNAEEIRALFGTVPPGQLAARFGISRGHLYQIIRGDCWKPIDQGAEPS